MSDTTSLLLFASVAGIGGGLVLLARGFSGYRRAGLVADTATSSVGTLAVGEVRVSGVVEPAELTLVSPVQSRPSVYYRARIREVEDRAERTVLDEERAVGFRVRDASGAIRVFPRGAAWDVPARLAESDDVLGEAPAGIDLRHGPAIQPAMADRETLVAQLLTVRPSFSGGRRGGGLLDGRASGGRRDYEEARIEPGDTITIVGTALPFEELPDPDEADLAEGAGLAGGGPLAATADPEIAADLEAARAAGILETDPEEAWGNAAIPGFGIGRPVRPPELDPAATAPPLADVETAERFERAFGIGPRELVIAVGPDRPMLVSAGGPSVAIGRGQDRFLVGLAGAVLAIGSAIGLAFVVSGFAGRARSSSPRSSPSSSSRSSSPSSS